MSKPTTRKGKIRASHHHQARKTWIKDNKLSEPRYPTKKSIEAIKKKNKK